MSELRAVLWDMDGTLIDTEPYWMRAEYDLVAAHGGTWSDSDGLALVGNDLLTSGRYVREHGGVDLPPEVIVEELLDRVIQSVRRETPWRAGARELLDAMVRAGLQLALVTMSYRRFVEAALASLPANPFHVVITGDEVTQGKPHPEAYLRALAELQVSPASAIVIEDSNTGATSAQRAGLRVIAAPLHVPIEAAPGRFLVDSLTEIDLDWIRSLPADR